MAEKPNAILDSDIWDDKEFIEFNNEEINNALSQIDDNKPEKMAISIIKKNQEKKTFCKETKNTILQTKKKNINIHDKNVHKPDCSCTCYNIGDECECFCEECVYY